MSERWWHGGPPIKGDRLLPSLATGVGRTLELDGWVYLARERSLALTYAATCNGWIYEVEPLTPIEQDPDSSLPLGDSVRCREARIVRRYKPSRAEVEKVSAWVNAIDRILIQGGV